MKNYFDVLIDGKSDRLFYQSTDGKKTTYEDSEKNTHLFPYGKGPQTWVKGHPVKQNGHTYLSNE